MKIIFHKYSGAGNDFILLSQRENSNFTVSPEFVKKVCERRMNIGADGVLFIAGSNDYDFDVTYYNADGTTGSLCGNGARCAIHFAITNGLVDSDKVVFTSRGVVYSGELLRKDYVKFNLNPPEDIRLNLSLPLNGKELKGHFADTGSPHLVFFFDEIKDELQLNDVLSSENFPIRELGKKFRYHPAFQPAGTNVNFVELEEEFLKIRTYERGVEDETLACGTGSVASAIIAFLHYGIHSPVRLLTKSGKFLTVEFNYNKPQFSDVNLTGPAEKIFSGYFNFDEDENE
jgi:diaminopimelate epimerase